MGTHYKQSNSVPKDDDEAVKGFRRAIANGNQAAQCSLGLCYEEGFVGGVHDTKQALFQFKRAASNGNVEAQYHYGRYLYDGLHCAKNVDLALELIRAADGGCMWQLRSI